MEEINVAELLRYCPKGMELDCLLFDGLEFDHIDTDNENYPIVCRAKTLSGEYNIHSFTKYGWFTAFFDYSKCVIFPKGKMSWEGFHIPFKDGDIVYFITENDNKYIAVFKDNKDVYLETYIDVAIATSRYSLDVSYYTDNIKEQRLATEEEKQKLFNIIKENGYKWNTEKKILEKLIQPKFKVGNKIVKKNSICVPILITNVSDEFYYSDTESSVGILSISEQDDYTLFLDRFDITTLKPFDKVLARDTSRQIWIADLFSHDVKEPFGGYRFACIGHHWHQCIPYEGNEHLLGTTNDCDEYFKNWK